MHKLVIILFILYAGTAMAIDKSLMTSNLLASDNKEYIDPKITILEFKKLVDEVAICESNTESELIDIGNNLLRIQIKGKNSLSGKGLPNEFTISYFKHKGEFKAFLQTHDRGPVHIFDESRFIPSSQIVGFLKILVSMCGKKL